MLTVISSDASVFSDSSEAIVLSDPVFSVKAVMPVFSVIASSEASVLSDASVLQ